MAVTKAAELAAGTVYAVVTRTGPASSVRLEGERGLGPVDRRTAVQPRDIRQPPSTSGERGSDHHDGRPDERGGQADLPGDDTPDRGPERLRPEQHDQVERETAGAYPARQEGLQRRVDRGEDGQPGHPGHESAPRRRPGRAGQGRGRPSWRRRQGLPGRAGHPRRSVHGACPARARRRSHPARAQRAARRSRPHRGATSRSPPAAAAPRWRSPAGGTARPGSARGARRATSARSRPRRAGRAGIARAEMERLCGRHAPTAARPRRRRTMWRSGRRPAPPRSPRSGGPPAPGRPRAPRSRSPSRGRKPPGSPSGGRDRGSSPARQGR